MKKFLKVLLTVAMLAACTITANAALFELAGYPITVYDRTTPAVFAAGTSWPITEWYLYAEDGEVLGSIPAKVVTELAKGDSTGSIQWEFRLADLFNEYRQMTGETPHLQSKPIGEKETVVESSPPAAESEQSDIDDPALQAFDLINEVRAENGLHELEISNEVMALAEMRVSELEEKYNHTRPDGTRISRTYYCGEIIKRRASTPKIAVESWLDSPGHREMILAERYHSAGIAYCKGADGVTYWCMLFCR